MKLEIYFQDTSSEDEVGNELLKTNLQVLQEEPSSLQEPANVLHILIHDKANANIPVKISGIKVGTSYDTGANMSCMSHACYCYIKFFWYRLISNQY